MYLLDTNIILEILLEQEKAEECVILLQKIRDGAIEATVSSFALHSIEVILSSAGKFSELEHFLNDLGQFKGLSIFTTTIKQELEITKIAKKESLDFDDALHYWIAQTFHLSIISFDHHFDRLKIKRIEPANIQNQKTG